MGPASSVDGGLVAFDGSTGTKLKAGPGVGVASDGDLLRRSDGDARYRAAGNVPQSEVTGLTGALAEKADLVDGKVPASQLPAPPTVPSKTTGAKVRAGTNDDEFVTPKSITDAAAYVTTPWAASLALDLSIPAQIVVLGWHTTLTAPTNVKPGVSARVLLKQPETGGPFTVSYNAAYLFFGPTPAASTAANAVDMLVLDPETTAKVSAVLQKGRAA